MTDENIIRTLEKAEKYACDHGKKKETKSKEWKQSPQSFWQKSSSEIYKIKYGTLSINVENTYIKKRTTPPEDECHDYKSCDKKHIKIKVGRNSLLEAERILGGKEYSKLPAEWHVKEEKNLEKIMKRLNVRRVVDEKVLEVIDAAEDRIAKYGRLESPGYLEWKCRDSNNKKIKKRADLTICRLKKNKVKVWTMDAKVKMRRKRRGPWTDCPDEYEKYIKIKLGWKTMFEASFKKNLNVEKAKNLDEIMERLEEMK